MKARSERFGAAGYICMAAAVAAAFVLCVCLGSVNIPLRDTVTAIWSAICGSEQSNITYSAIITGVRVPRVLCVALTGAALSLCGGAMQGLLKNPLADGSTLGVSSGASIGAILAMTLGVTIPGIPGGGTTLMAIVFAFGSLVLIMALVYKTDHSLATNTIILMGIVFSMFANSVISILITFAGEKVVRGIIFWMMGSLQGAGYGSALLLSVGLVVFGALILSCSRELNAFAVGEDNARAVGVNVKKVKLIILLSVSALIGVCVSVGGTIGFVGLVIPHMTRLVVGPNHRRLLPAAMFSGATLLMLADLLSRVIVRPKELPIGVVTSFVGAIVFVYIFYSSRKAR